MQVVQKLKRLISNILTSKKAFVSKMFKLNCAISKRLVKVWSQLDFQMLNLTAFTIWYSF